MDTITITKAEYKKLLFKAKAYEKLARNFFESSIKEQVEDIVNDFRDTDLYTKEFLTDLEEGLRKSSLGKLKK